MFLLFFRDNNYNFVLLLSISNIKLFTDDIGRALEEKLSKSGYPGKAVFIECDVTKADDVKVGKSHQFMLTFCVMCIFAYSLSRGMCVLCAFHKHMFSHKDLLRA